MKPIVDNQRLIVALDFPSTEGARRLVAQLDNSVNFYKVGLELFMADGYFEFVDVCIIHMQIVLYIYIYIYSGVNI